MSRRRVLRWSGLAAAAGALGYLGFNRPAANAYYAGPPSDHFDGRHFFNAGAEKPKPLTDLLKWQFFSGRAAWPSAFAQPSFDTPPSRVGGERIRIAFIGHASFLLQTAGRNILVDPVYARRASPLSFAGPQRVNPPAVPFSALPPIDTILVTHNHYDHLDVDALGRLVARDAPRIVTPLGNDTIIRAAVPAAQVTAHDWGEVIAIAPGLSVHVEPTLHWSARGLRDRRHALWASFVVATPAGKIYCVGDSGFGDGRIFAGIGRRHPGIRAALLPIGAYEPRWFMAGQHMNPAEAVEALKLCGAARGFGHHWATFQLTNEAIEQPRLDLAAARTAAGVPDDRFEALLPGMVRWVDAASAGAPTSTAPHQPTNFQ